MCRGIYWANCSTLFGATQTAVANKAAKRSDTGDTAQPPAPPPGINTAVLDQLRAAHLNFHAAHGERWAEEEMHRTASEDKVHRLMPGEFAIDNADRWDERVMQPLLQQVTAELGCSAFAPMQMQ